MSDPILFETTYEEEIYKFPVPTTVVLDVKWKDLPESEVLLLEKILSSVKLSLAAVRIVETQKLDLSTWTDKPTKLIGFGVKVSGVNLYEVVTTPETQLVLADGLSILSKDDELKKKLWVSLKQLFFGPLGG